MEFTLADPGEGIHEVDILEVHVSSGDEVNDGDDLFTVESDKAVTEVPSSFSGRITEIAVSAGDTVEVGQVLLRYETEEAEQEEQPEQPGTDAEEPEEQAEQPEEPEEQGEPDTDAEESEQEAAAAEQADETEEDERPGTTDAAVAGAGDGTHKPRGSSLIETHRPVPASPATRSLADRLGVDLQQLEGSGPDGRIEPEDVQAAAEQKPSEERSGVEDLASERDAGKRTEGGLPDFGKWGEIERRELRSVRRATAKAMQESWHRIPHVSHMDAADITELEAARARYAEEHPETPLTLTAYLMKAAVAALRQHPTFNASYDVESGELVLKRYYNIGIAVDTDDGLVVPVIADVDSKPMSELARELGDVADRMRAGDRNMEDFEGGSFTITNPGGIGGTGFTPIINHPEVAILGAARAEWRLIVDESEEPPERRLHLPLVLAFDHRVNDGADAARFMRTLVEALEDPGRLLIEA